MNDIFILETALAIITEHLNDLVESCLDEKGKPIAPTRQQIAKARGMLPKKYSMSYQK